MTDPPYNVALGSHMRPSEARQLHRRTDGLVIDNDDWADEEEFIGFLQDALGIALAHMQPGAAFYIWHASNTSSSFLEACKRCGMRIRQTLIWAKSTFALGRQDYQWQHEPCLYGWKDGAPHYFTDSRKESTLLSYDKPARNEEHPTMKPIDLIAYLVANSSKKGDLVLDCFGGSGTTMIACEQLGRRCSTMEIDPHYCDVMLSRWEQLTGKEAVRVDQAL